MTFSIMCRHNDDVVQDSWLQLLTTLTHRRELLPNAQTREELHEHYNQHGAMATTIYKRCQTAQIRQQKGRKNSPHKQRILQQITSLENLVGTQREPYEESSEMHRIEAKIALDQEFQKLSPEQQEAVRYFLLAWNLQEEGKPVPKSMRQRIYRDRKRTGLRLELERGRRQQINSEE